MTFEEQKFPYKWFNAIINTLNKEKNDSHLLSFEIASQIGSCVSDASESTRMLYYLLHFGKLDKDQHGKWYLISDSPNNFPEIDFRIKYLQNLVEILKIIQNADHPIHIDELTEIVNFGSDYVLQALEFYASISQKGKIYSEGKGYQRSWRIIDWPSK
ncbi:hypothetical protein [Candidatus Hodarchaeum mangrovi]